MSDEPEQTFNDRLREGLEARRQPTRELEERLAAEPEEPTKEDDE